MLRRTWSRLVVGALSLAAAATIGGAWDAAGSAAWRSAEAAKESGSEISTTSESRAQEAASAPRSRDAARMAERRLAVMRAELASLEADRDEATAKLDVDRAEAAQASFEHDVSDLDARDKLAMLDVLAAAQAAQVSQYEAMVRAKEAEIRIAERRAKPATGLGA